ncbi:MAG: acetyltransferase [Anaerolineae bacterium]
MSEIKVETTPLLILGAGTFALEVADLVSDLPGYEVCGFAVSQPPYTPGATLLDRPIYWVDDLAAFGPSCHAVCAIVSTTRWKFIERVKRFGIPFATIIHPSARVSRTARVRAGTIISAGAVISAYAEIGEHVIVNRGALIGHHVKLGHYITISPGVNIGGSVSIGERTYVGLGAMILEQRVIGEAALIGAGALVNRDVAAHVLVTGNPATVVTGNVDGY